MGGLRIQGVYAHGQPWTAGMEGKKTEDCGRDKHAIVNQHAVRDIMFFNQSVNRDAPLPESYFQKDSNAAKSLLRQYPQVNFIFVETNVYSEEMEQFISQVRQGAYILMPFDVLDWMSQGEEAAGQGMEMIGQAVCRLARNLKAGAYSTGVVLGERGEDIYWTAFDTQEDTVKEECEREAENVRGMLERMEESRKRIQERMKKLKLVKKKKINYQMGRDMARLAKGTTVKEIRFLISRVYASRRPMRENQIASAERGKSTGDTPKKGAKAAGGEAAGGTGTGTEGAPKEENGKGACPDFSEIIGLARPAGKG